MDQCDVLIIGAGPTGLMMASELARYGMQCRIIDKSQDPSDKSKALAIQPRTMEIFHFLGIDSEFLQKGHKIKALNIMSNRSAIGHVDFKPLDSPFPFILSLPQSVTEEILTRHLMSFGLEIERSKELVGLKETGSGIIADIQCSLNKREQIAAKWVIGCDGAHSFVRKHLNLTFKGKAFPDVFSLADVQLDWKYSHDEVFAFWRPEGILAAIPLPQKGCYRLIFELGRCQGKPHQQSPDNLQVEIPPPSLEEVTQIVHQRADSNAVVSNPMWLANFHVNSRLASRYQVGNVFLAGDAVHIHSPVGGQGMNTGLQDAFNLAWKIAWVHQGKLSMKTLSTYHEERYATAMSLLKGTEFATHVAALKKGWQISLRNALARIILSFPLVQNKMIRVLSQINIRYQHNLMINESGKSQCGPKAGSRMSNLMFEREGSCVQLYDLLIKIDSFLVLFFIDGDSDLKQLEPLINDLEKLPIPIKTLIVTKTPVSQKDSYLFADHAQFGAEKGACYVIRPDTYIGYRQTPIDPAALLNYFKQVR